MRQACAIGEGFAPGYLPDRPPGTPNLALRPLGCGGVAFELGRVGLELLLLELGAALHRPLDLCAHVRERDDDQPGLARVEVLAELLEVVTAHAGRRVPRNGAEERAARRRAHEQPAADGGEGKQRDDEAGGQPDAASEHAAGARRRLVLGDDLGLAAFATFDDRRVIGVDQTGLGVQVLDELVVGLRVPDAVIDPHVDHQRVECHRFLRCSSYGVAVGCAASGVAVGCASSGAEVASGSGVAAASPPPSPPPLVAASWAACSSRALSPASWFLSPSTVSPACSACCCAWVVWAF